LTNDTVKTDHEITIREMKPSDVETIAELEKKIFPDPWARSAFEELLNEDSWNALVAETDGRIIGYACFYFVDIEAHLANIGVVEEYRRKSVAKRLLETILRRASENNCEYVILEVRPSGTAARAFYKKHGFEILYRRPEYYRHPVEDAYVMIRYLRDKDR